MTSCAASNSKSRLVCPKIACFFDLKSLAKFLPGIVSANSEIEKAEIKDNLIMFLGNDFGTVSYLEEKCSRGREENNKTIQNLLGLNLDLGKCFFTNFFLGLRDDKLNPGTTNIKKIAKFQEDYVKMCYDFFLVQLALINPKIIVCLGKEVGQTLSELNSQFSKFELKNRSFSKLYDENDFVINTKDDLMGTRKFVLIPHPSFAHINWGNEIKQKIKAEIIL